MRLVLCLLLLCFAAAGAEAAALCGSSGVALQVLGSGGLEVQDKRASTSYLIWQDGKTRALIDSGGGSPLRFGESGADFVDLDVVLFTHLHADHSAGFPSLVKSSYFQDRRRPLPVFGPTGNRAFPATTAFVNALFDDKHGAFRYLSEFVDPKAQSSYKIEAMFRSFFGVRKRRDYESDAAGIMPVRLVVARLIGTVLIGGPLLVVACNGQRGREYG